MTESVRVRRFVQTLLIIYIATVGVAAVVIGVWAWRTAERAGADEEVTVIPASLLGWDFDVSVETSIFLIVIAFGVLGGMVHAANSLASYIGNRRFTTSWAPWYALRPIIAAVLAMLAYTVFRAGFLSTEASAENINLFGVAAIAGLAGLFSKQVIDKLEDVMKVIFASKADEERTDKLGGIAITGVAPETTSVGTPIDVVITGTGFGPGIKVRVNDVEREPAAQANDTVTVTLTAEDVATAGTLELKVVSSSGEISSAVTFTVTEAAG